MDLSAITYWLKSSLFGMIILGAVGSILAVLLQYISKVAVRACSAEAGRMRMEIDRLERRYVNLASRIDMVGSPSLAVYMVADLLAQLMLGFALLIIAAVATIVSYAILPPGIGRIVSSLALGCAFGYVHTPYRIVRCLFQRYLHVKTEQTEMHLQDK